MSGVSEEQLQSATNQPNNSNGGIPLTTWMNSALNSIANNTSPQSPPQQQGVSNKINSTSYTSAALNIAQSLICQLNLSYTIGDGAQQELILPNDISNWSNSIVIQLNTNNNSSNDNSGEQSIEPILNVSRAEFIIVKENEQLKCLSRDENKHIYSLVRVCLGCYEFIFTLSKISSQNL